MILRRIHSFCLHNPITSHALSFFTLPTVNSFSDLHLRPVLSSSHQPSGLGLLLLVSLPLYGIYIYILLLNGHLLTGNLRCPAAWSVCPQSTSIYYRLQLDLPTRLQATNQPYSLHRMSHAHNQHIEHTTCDFGHLSLLSLHRAPIGSCRHIQPMLPRVPYGSAVQPLTAGTQRATHQTHTTPHLACLCCTCTTAEASTYSTHSVHNTLCHRRTHSLSDSLTHVHLSSLALFQRSQASIAIPPNYSCPPPTPYYQPSTTTPATCVWTET